ncbi:uncharacterized protein LOC141690954 [Apium graveolens]|uniref:uncharacterized protein LOC141690954 n=1 Tax=Apium graveolens TaxID=4045 RepID=UPI003D7AC78D
MFNNYLRGTGKAGNQKGLNWLSWKNMSYAKSKRGLGFRDLYGFNIALHDKHIWSFLHNTNSLVSRLFKARFFSNSTILKAGKGRKSSFIWQCLWTGKEELIGGFIWVLGNGDDIAATKDPWLRMKMNFYVEPNPFYDGRNEVISSLFCPNEKKWNHSLIKDHFLKEDADVILAVHIPQRDITDRMVWTRFNSGVYNTKSGYHHWFNKHFWFGTADQCVRCKKVWHLQVPHKVKVFIWRFCRNVIHVRRRLSARGARVPITCPICLNDIEHMTHLFFNYDFAGHFKHHVGLRECGFGEIKKSGMRRLSPPRLLWTVASKCIQSD